jgi:hypothetical protein
VEADMFDAVPIADRMTAVTGAAERVFGYLDVMDEPRRRPGACDFVRAIRRKCHCRVSSKRCGAIASR